MHQPTKSTSATSFGFGDPDFLYGTYLYILAIGEHLQCDLNL